MFDARISADGRQLLFGHKLGTLSCWRLDWEYEFPGWADWDDGALPYAQTFLALHPDYTAADFENFITELQNRGYGWLRPEGAQAKLDEIQFG